MDYLHHLISSITIEQIAFAIGTLTFLLHSVLNRHDKLSKPLNLFIVRFTSLVFPILTVLATDPSVSALVHSYFPALLGFFTAYQGFYHFMKAATDKWDSLKKISAPAEQTA